MYGIILVSDNFSAGQDDIGRFGWNPNIIKEIIPEKVVPFVLVTAL